MEKIEIKKIANKSPFTHILNDDIVNKVFPHLEKMPDNKYKEEYEELIGTNTDLYIMYLIFLVIFEIALIFTIDLLELLLVSIIVIALIAFITTKIIKSINIVNNTEIRYNTLSINEVKEAEDGSSFYFVKVEDKKNKYLIDEWIEVDKKYNKGDEVIFFIISYDKTMTMQCKDTGKTIKTIPQETPEEEEIL